MPSSKGWVKRQARIAALLLAGLLSFTCTVPAESLHAQEIAVSGEGEGIVVEGEHAASHNFAGSESGIIDDPAYSGGKYLRLSATEEAPAGGYIASYEVQVPVSGVYELRITATPADEVWTSPYSIRINDGEYRPVSDAKETGRVNDTVRKYIVGLVQLQEGVNTITFKVDERRKLGDNKYILFLDAIGLIKVPLGIYRIHSDAPMNVFEADDDASLTVELSENVVSAANVSVEVRNYWQQVVYTGNVSVPAHQREAHIELGKLDKGHYTVSVHLNNTDSEMTTYFSVVVPYHERNMTKSSPFAIDAAYSHLVKPGDIPDFAEALKRLGVQWVRDRFMWSVVNPESGVFDYSHYDPLIQAVAEKGIRIVDVYADAPAWTQSKAGDKLPTDLIAAYRFATDSASHYYDAVQAWEIWNEQDAAFTSPDESADQYAAYLKAAAIGYRDSTARPLIAVGGLAYRPGDYAEQLMDNEMLPFIDIYNLHSYPKAYANGDPDVVPFPDYAAWHRDFLRSHNGGSKQFWMTEAGIPIAANGSNDMTPQEQRAQARYLVTSTVQSLAAGVDKHFWFVMPYYKEGTSQYGMFNADNAPYPAYAAEANMTDVLGEARYARPQTNLPAGAQGYWFRNGNNSVLVLWSEQPQTIKLDLKAGVAELIDMMGENHPINTGWRSVSIQAGPDPIYVKVDNPSLAEAGVRHNKSDRSGKIKTAPPLSKAERVVLNQKYPDSARENIKALGAYKLEMEEANRIEVEVYNFNDSTVSGSIMGDASGGWNVSPAVRQVTLAPYERKVLTFDIAAGPEAKRNAIERVTFKGLIGGKRTTASVARISTELSDVQVEPIAGADDPAKWLPNISPGGQSHITAGADPGSVRFKYEFADDVKWAYPFFGFAPGADYTGKDGIAFMLYSEQGVPETELRIMVNETNGSTYYTSTGMTIKPGWNKIIVPFGSLVWANFGVQDDNSRLDTDRLRGIQIGINTTLNDVPAFTLKEVGTYSIPRQ